MICSSQLLLMAFAQESVDPMQNLHILLDNIFILNVPWENGKKSIYCHISKFFTKRCTKDLVKSMTEEYMCTSCQVQGFEKVVSLFLYMIGRLTRGKS